MDRSPIPRVVVEKLGPVVDDGAFPVRRVAGGSITVEADLFADGTEAVAGLVELRRPPERAVQVFPMTPIGDDRYRARVPLPEPGVYRYTVRAWTDPFATWREALGRRVAAGTVTAEDLRAGAALLRALSGAAGRDRARWRAYAEELARAAEGELDAAVVLALAPGRIDPLALAHDPARSVRHRPELSVQVDPVAAGASAWYELFPRSMAGVPGRSGTFADVARALPRLAELGFDVVYLPPIHPIGRTGRRGPRNAPTAGPLDPGSPWAIGGPEGGHLAVHPDLGTLEEFRALLAEARRHGIDLALDLAFQCSPDHPWVEAHPGWFAHRPDGSIRTAENPPKRYDDIYPFDFDSPEAPALWLELRHVVEFWIGQGVRRFRVDNPHTKPFAFWAWLIGGVRERHPEVLFLAEAFTRPKVMYRLAKLGFTHSYTYFAWRNTKSELQGYFGELGASPVREFFRPHLWPNTPDILTGYLQEGGLPAFRIRFVLAATLAPNYGIYGPPFERAEAAPAGPGEEEYLSSEKYEIRVWDRPGAPEIVELLRTVNRLRREHPALRSGEPPRFQRIDNDALLGYVRIDPEGGERLLLFVNLDPHRVQSGWTDLDLGLLGIADGTEFSVEDLLTGRTFRWRGAHNFVELRPAEMPAHLFALHAGPDGGG